MIKKIVEYLNGVKNELKKVKWPTRKEAVRLTIVVVALVFIFSAYIGVLDYIFTYLIRLFV